MTPLIGFLLGFGTLFFKDMAGYRKAKKEDPNAKFDWVLAFCMWASGGIAGVGLGAGFENAG